MRRVLLFVSVFAFTYKPIFAQVLGTPIVTWDFAGGLPGGWETGIASTNNIAHWEYRGPSTTPNINVGSRGSCAGTALPINSVTKANGFMIFDSNYWDDGDMVCGGLGTGADPAPHNAWMITNPVNLTSNPFAVLTFQQQFRHYQTTVTKVEISINNGAWTEILANSGTQSPTVEWKSVNVSALAGGQSNVRFKFSFIGVYYWWLLDDITLYAPNANDVLLNWVGYTTNPFGQAATPYSDLQYDQYPSVMIPPFSFRGRATNVGANVQTNVRLNTRIVRNNTTETLNTNSTPITLEPSAASTIVLTPNYTNPAQLGDYKIYYDILQNESDDNLANDKDSLDYSITSYSYARDEGPMVDFYEPTGIYTQWAYEIGNMFQARAANKYCHSLQVALAEGTQPGAQITGFLYAENMETIIGQTNVYTVNIADLNTIGEEKIATLHFPSPILLTNGAYYMAMISQNNVSQAVKVARSGSSPSETSYVRYLSVNGNFYSTVTPIVRMNIFNAGVISGCMDSEAMNYSASATANDGSCRYSGCTDENATNYDPEANYDNGTCVVAGCMNPLADNYNPNATVDDGSCIFQGCTDDEADNYDPLATIDDGSCIYSGCTNPNAVNYDPQANQDDGSCIILGCLDSEADNYNPEANQDDGSCIYYGCTNVNADNYDPTANTDDGSCIISGCTNPDATNFDPQANLDDGSCIILGCMDVSADNYNPQANQDDGSCIYYGCTDNTAVNYDPEANTDDGSCTYLEVAMTVSSTEGCAPYTVTVTNQTFIGDGSVCNFLINDELLYDECLASFEYTFESSGSYNLTYIYQMGESISDSTVTIIVHPSPDSPALSYNDEFFEVTCSNCGSNSIQWFYNDSVILDSTDTSVGIHYNDVYRNGYYSATVTNQDNCTASLSAALFVLQPYFSLSNEEGCAPLELEVTNLTNPVANVSYSLNFGDGSVDNDFTTTANHMYSDAYSYEITVIANSPLGSGSYTKALEIHPVITPELVHVPNDGLVVCQNCNLFESVEWNIDGVIFNDFGPHSDNGENYTVTGTTEFGCTGSNILQPVFVVNWKNPKTGFQVYPNPVADFAVIDNNHGLPYQLDVYDFTGQIILSKQIQSTKERLDLSSWSSGAYILRMSNSDGVRVFNLTVVH